MRPYHTATNPNPITTDQTQRNHAGMARAGCNLGVCYFSLGLHERAIDFHLESRAMYEVLAPFFFADMLCLLGLY